MNFMKVHSRTSGDILLNFDKVTSIAEVTGDSVAYLENGKHITVTDDMDKLWSSIVALQNRR